jgi:hypothetical protein
MPSDSASPSANCSTWTDRELVHELCQIDSGLSSWEVNFVDSLPRQLMLQQGLSVNQRRKAEQIWREKGA